MTKKLTQAGEGGGCTPTTFQFSYHHLRSCSVRSSYFISIPMDSGVEIVAVYSVRCILSEKNKVASWLQREGEGGREQVENVGGAGAGTTLSSLSRLSLGSPSSPSSVGPVASPQSYGTAHPRRISPAARAAHFHQYLGKHC
jgi:hypothetical protein